MRRSRVLTWRTEAQENQDEEGDPDRTDRATESWTGARDDRKHKHDPGESEPEPGPGFVPLAVPAQ